MFKPTCHIFVYVVILPNQILLSLVWQQSCSMKSICSAVSATAKSVRWPHDRSFLSSSSCDIAWSLSYSPSTTPEAFASNFLSTTSQPQNCKLNWQDTIRCCNHRTTDYAVVILSVCLSITLRQNDNQSCCNSWYLQDCNILVFKINWKCVTKPSV